jgi:predicted O-methyltransferase YrrM
MVKIFELLQKGYKYLSTQDEPLWRTLLFVFKARPKTTYDFIFKKNSGAELPTTISIDPHDLCHDISRAINIDKDELWKHHEEFITNVQFHNAIINKLKSTAERPNELPEYGWREFLFIVVRAVKPNIMIETGSFDGLSTAVILLAMAKNNRGTLFTIDLPNPRLPSDIKADPAWIVPDYLRNRLQLKKGKSSEHLESIIEQVEGVDLFYHDSWHTYENLMFEYQTAWSALNQGGLLMSEYLPDLNDAFKDFIKDKDNIPIILANYTQFILQKS